MDIDSIQMKCGRKMLLHEKSNDLPLKGWVEKNKDDVESFLSTNGILLIRGLEIGSEDFGDTLSSLFGGELLSYTYRSTPRTELKNNIYFTNCIFFVIYFLCWC